MGLFYGRAAPKGSETGRGFANGRLSDPMDRELADAGARPLCVRHETRAAVRPQMVRAALWRGLVARWALRKCPACRGFPDAAPCTDDAELDASLADVADVIEAKHAGRGDVETDTETRPACAWCARIIGDDGRPAGDGTRAVSHGICVECRDNPSNGFVE